MKRTLLASLSAAAALCACSSSNNGGTTTGGGGGGDAGFTTITFATVDIHPAAKAALTAAGAPVPSLTDMSPGGGPYKLVIQGVSIASAASPECPNPPICLTTLFSTPITAGATYSYQLYNGSVDTVAPLGVLGGIAASTPDGGDPASPANLTQLPCSAVETAGIANALLDGGIPDYFLPTGSQVGGEAAPPQADVLNAVAYAVPMSYASMLNCAGQPTKATRDSDVGVALVYATNGSGPAVGTPVSGVTVSIAGATNTPTINYYSNNYAASGTATDATGVATAVDVATGTTPPTLTAHDAAGDAFVKPGIATDPNSFFNVFVYVP